jgi:hypothetical protein
VGPFSSSESCSGISELGSGAEQVRVAREAIKMKILIYLLRGFVYFAGITPPNPETERRDAIILFLALIAGTALLGALIYTLFPSFSR